MSNKSKPIDRFAAAVAHHGAGRLQEARRLYEAVLQKEPNHVAAMNNLAILLQGDKGIALLQRALSVEPGYLDALSNLARMLEQAGRLAEAEATRARGRQVVAERHRPPPGHDLFANSTGPGERNPVKRNTKMSASPGHFYSPIPDLDEVKARESAIFSIPRELPGIDLHEDRQLALLEKLAGYYAEMPFTEDASEGNLYQLNNAFFSYSDGLFLYCMMRHLAPRRIPILTACFSTA